MGTSNRKQNCDMILVDGKEVFITSSRIGAALSAVNAGHSSIADVCKFVDRSERSVGRYLQALEEAGIIYNLPQPSEKGKKPIHQYYVKRSYERIAVNKINEAMSVCGFPQTTDNVVKIGDRYLVVSKETLRIMGILRSKRAVSAADCVVGDKDSASSSRVLHGLFKHNVCTRKSQTASPVGSRMYLFSLTSMFFVVKNVKVILAAKYGKCNAVRSILNQKT